MDRSKMAGVDWPAMARSRKRNSHSSSKLSLPESEPVGGTSSSALGRLEEGLPAGRSTWSIDMKKMDTGGFPDMLATQAADLCKRLATEREVQFAQLHMELVEECDRLRSENLRLTSEMSVIRVVPPTTLPVGSSQEIEGSSNSPNRRMSDSYPPASPRPEDSCDLEAQHLGGGRTNTAGSMDNPFSLGVSDVFLLKKVFKDLDKRRAGQINPKDVAGAVARATGKRDLTEDALTEAFTAVNVLLLQDWGLEDGLFMASESDSPISFVEKESVNVFAERSTAATLATLDYSQPSPGELNFDGFRFLILKDDIDNLVPRNVAATIHEIREFYVRWTTDSMILEKTQVDKDELSQNLGGDVVPFWLEPVIGILIMLNALAIGVSQDVWNGSLFWTVAEVFFSICFAAELLIKLRCVGCREHFCGHGFVWNWFDLTIVIIALLDVFFLLLDELSVGSLPGLNTLTVVRLIRLIRMARLVRLLRMKFFKELTLMVNGVIGGLRTLCWAFVFLGGLVFILGVLMRQLFALNDTNCLQVQCTEAEEFLYRHRKTLFSSVFRSMITVFRCLIGDCNAPDGLPIVPHLQEGLGFLFTLGYVAVTCFVLFGVFNLIMAIFVENTLEAARVNQQKRQMARNKEHVRVAQELREIVLRICQRNGNTSKRNLGQPWTPTASGDQRLRSSVKSLKRAFWGGEDDESNVTMQFEDNTLESSVSRPIFEEVMQDPKVLDILEDLEISVTDRSRLFDVLDSNGSGSLDVGEIIEGLMKLRGPADKGDIVCASLMVRSVQRDLMRLDQEMSDRHKMLQDRSRALEQNQARILLALNDKDRNSFDSDLSEQAKTNNHGVNSTVWKATAPVAMLEESQSKAGCRLW